MRHIFKLLAASVAAATICSCSSLTGYPQHFTRLFKKCVGQSPNEYRTQN